MNWLELGEPGKCQVALIRRNQAKMDTQRAKTFMLRVLGETVTSQIQGVRFAYIMKRYPLPDPEVGLIPRIAHRGDITVDVGANGANWTNSLHLNVGDIGRVFAFEADPYYARATHATIRIMRMRGVYLFHFGLSDKEEDVPLRITDEFNQRVSGLGYIDKSAKTERKGVAIVRLKTLDSLVGEFPELLRTVLIKCDVEGYELFVFRGAQRVLEKARPVVIFEVDNFQKQGYSAGDMYSFFKERRYTSFAMVSGSTLAETDTHLNHELALSVNRLAIPDEKIASILAT